ncbi:uncharacterized protein LOC103120026 [Erinaceus europaeus]|uniref:Uncharacterized protein LOC103120026 n=1 Tax=Erinaceus europaeus TaxID=9365 RepID=A0A1S3A745_ERIEU|nr:uncharacterized protein LOC103120026 [Erinaceus europaeus]
MEISKQHTDLENMLNKQLKKQLHAGGKLAMKKRTALKTGTWYIKAMVVNKELPKEKRPTSMAPVIVTALDGGELEATHTFMKKGQCHEMKIVLQPTDDPGKYTAHGGKKNVQIEEMLTEDHYMLFIQGQCHGNPFRMVKLLGKGASPFSAPQRPPLLSPQFVLLVADETDRCQANFLDKLVGKVSLRSQAHSVTSPAGRTPDLNLNALEEFKTFIKSKDLPEESIFLPTQMGKEGAAKEKQDKLTPMSS